MTVTQKQIAERVGVSQVLVGKALAGRGRMQEATRDTILRAARQLGYSQASNVEARRLVARRHGGHVRTRMIAVLGLHHYSGTPLFDLPLPQGLLLGIQSEALARDLDVMVTINKEGSLPRLMSAGMLDGVITFQNNKSLIAAKSESSPPFVGLMTYCDGMAQIEPDDVTGMRTVVDHLIELGHERIAFAGIPQDAISTPKGRYDGYIASMKAAGLTVDPSRIDLDLAGAGTKEGEASLKGLIARCPEITAIVCINDNVATGILEAARSMDIDVPGDLSIVGFGDFMAEPVLTSVAYDRYQMGRRAVELIESAVAGDLTFVQPSYRELFPTKLIVRCTQDRRELATRLLSNDRRII